MRNSRLKQKSELKRKSELKSKTPIKRGDSQLKRTQIKPKPAAKTVRKAAAKAQSTGSGFPSRTVRLIKDRSEGLCEIGLLCLGSAPATESAHRAGKGSGGVGVKNEWSRLPSNALRGCSRDHRLVDGANGGDAYRLGLKVRHGVALPAEMPVHHYRLGWVLLDDDGGWTSAPAASYRGERLFPVVQVVYFADGEWDDAPIYQAMQRFGHLDCGGWSYPLDGVLTCGCGDELFVVGAR